MVMIETNVKVIQASNMMQKLEVLARWMVWWCYFQGVHFRFFLSPSLEMGWMEFGPCEI
jgi:hypothetical protein